MQMFDDGACKFASAVGSRAYRPEGSFNAAEAKQMRLRVAALGINRCYVGIRVRVES